MIRVLKPIASERASEGGVYRWELRRQWRSIEWPHRGWRSCVFIGLNPSTADAERDDPTVRRMMGFARREGADELVVVNLFALRSTNPRALETARNAVGNPENDEFITSAVMKAGLVVLAWGARGGLRHRDAAVLKLLAGVHRWSAGGVLSRVEPLCLGRTRSGAPRHPLYVRHDVPLQPFPLPYELAPCRGNGLHGVRCKDRPGLEIPQLCDTCRARRLHPR